MSENRYSLCIAELDYKTNEIRNKVWRVADFDYENQCFVEAKYNDWEEEKTIENYNPSHIRAFVNTLTPYKAEIRSWRTISGLNSFNGDAYISTESDSLNEYPIEIIFLSQFDLDTHNSDSNIRAALQNGIVIPNYISEKFFVVVNKSNNSYECLLCSRKDFQNSTNTDTFKIQKHCLDMLRAVHNLNLYIVDQNEVIGTDQCTMFVEQGKKASTRYFYKYLVEDRYERKFFLRDPEDYAKAYISRYIKNKKEILKISKSDAQKWSAMIDEALTTKNDIELFFDETGFKFSDVENALEDLSGDIKELYLQDDAFSQIVERSLLKDFDVLQKCKEEAKNIWFLEQDDERERLLNETQAVRNELSFTIAQKIDLTDEISEITDNIERLKNDCNELECKERTLLTKCSQIQADISEKLKCFQEDVVHLAALSALSYSNTEITTGLPMPYIVQPVINHVLSHTEIDEIDGFIDDLQDNLATFGLINDHSYDVSLFMVTAVIKKKNFVICGSKVDEIANSISLLIEKQAAKQVYLPIGFSDISKLINIINQSTSKVFVINNALETVSDSVFLSLSKCCKDKILFFACEDSNTYKHFPSQWSNYAVFIYPDMLWGLPLKDDLLCTKFDLLNQKTGCSIEKNEIIKQIEILGRIKPVQLNEISQLIRCYKKLSKSANELTYTILCNIINIFSGDKDEFFDLLEQNKVSKNVIELLKGEFCYE